METPYHHMACGFSESYPRKQVLEYLKAFKTGKISSDTFESSLNTRPHVFDSAKSSVTETSWDDWSAKDLSKTLTDLSSHSQKDKWSLMRPNESHHLTELELCKPFIHPSTGKLVEGFFEVDTGVVDLFSDQLIPSPQFWEPDKNMELHQRVDEVIPLKGVSVDFERIKSHIEYSSVRKNIRTSCDEHSLHFHIVNIHRSTDWELYESCFDLDNVLKTITPSAPSLKERFEEKISSIASPQSKYSQTKRGNTRHSTVLGVDQQAVDSHQFRNECTYWGLYSYEDGYMDIRKQNDFFYFFEILIAHPENPLFCRS